MSDIVVKVLKPKGDLQRAQLYVGQTAGPATPFSEFSAAMQERLRAAEPGQKIYCEPIAKPTPATVLPLASAPAAPAPVRREPPPEGHLKAQAPPRDAPDVRTVVGYDRATRAVRFENGSSLQATALPFADQVLTLRPGARLMKDRDGWTVAYAPDVRDGVGPEPDVNRNPYNFAAIEGSEPLPAEDPVGCTHDQEHAGRHSGVVRLTLAAQSPIFVPEGRLQHEDLTAPYAFFHCWNGEAEQYAIPGSTIKGAVRSLYEAFTNSRMGVTDAKALKDPPLYRRRSSELYRIKSLPTASKPGKAVRCHFEFRDELGKRVEVRGLPVPPVGVPLREQEWRANLFWVRPDSYSHGSRKCRIAWADSPSTDVDLSLDVMNAYLRMRGHSHFRRHPDNVANNKALSKYVSRGPEPWRAPAYEQCEADLFSLNESDLVFGIASRGALACFGKNVNFLWPGASSPLQLLGRFRERPQDEPSGMKLTDADPAEAGFGFAATHDPKTGSHPFRGRIRFSTFWGPVLTEPLPLVELMPLTSPAGTKVKARPLYLEPHTDGQSAHYDGSARLRGRKFYWHQNAGDGTIPMQHRYDLLRKNNVREIEQKMRPAPIRPLPSDTQFSGEIQFDNLTDAELGALLACVAPQLAFGDGSYGIKVGKGKPRGLGSVQCVKRDLRLLRADRYAAWDAEEDESGDPATYVAAYKRWISGQLGREWDAIGFVKDLSRLLQIPRETSVRVYPPTFHMYGWGPEWNDPSGDPKGGARSRPPAMRRASDDQSG